MPVNIPETGQHRIVIIGAGFAGLKLARLLYRHNFQIVLIDRNNYHQFQPLFYQVARWLLLNIKTKARWQL